MKKLKLLLATVLVFAMTFALVACSAPIVGMWECTETTVVNAQNSTMEIKSDGTVILSNDDTEQVWYWTFEDDVFSIYDNEEREGFALEYKYKNGKLKLKIGEIEEVYEKK